MNNSLRRLSSLSRQFFGWWGAELIAFATDIMGLIAPSWRRPVSVFIDADRLVIRTQYTTGPITLLDIRRNHWQSPLPDSLPDTLPRAFDGGRRARLVVATDRAFICQWRLPLAAMPHLKSAISLQLSKLMPMPIARLMTDFEVGRADPSKGIVDVDIAALKRADIDPIVKTLQAWGLRVASIRLADSSDGRERFRFATAAVRGRESGIRRVDQILIASAAALGLACAALATTQNYRSNQALERAKNQTATAAAVALGQRQALISRIEPLIELSQSENAPSAVALLADVTQLVPHDAWLTTFELKDHHVRLVGVSPDPAQVVRHLASSALLTDVELRSALSTGIGTGKDRFELTAELRTSSP